MSPRFDFTTLPLAERLELATDLLDSIASEDPAMLVDRADLDAAAGRGSVAEPAAGYGGRGDGGNDELDDDELDALIAREGEDDELDEEDEYARELDELRRAEEEELARLRGRRR